MNWMIDGAYGDLYRDAMGYPSQQPARDEWDVERNLHCKPKDRRSLSAPLRELVKDLAAKLRATGSIAPKADLKPASYWFLF